MIKGDMDLLHLVGFCLTRIFTGTEEMLANVRQLLNKLMMMIRVSLLPPTTRRNGEKRWMQETEKGKPTI